LGGEFIIGTVLRAANFSREALAKGRPDIEVPLVAIGEVDGERALFPTPERGREGGDLPVRGVPGAGRNKTGEDPHIESDARRVLEIAQLEVEGVSPRRIGAQCTLSS